MLRFSIALVSAAGFLVAAQVAAFAQDPVVLNAHSQVSGDRVIAPTTIFVIGQDPLKEKESHATVATIVAQPTAPPFSAGGQTTAVTNTPVTPVTPNVVVRANVAPKSPTPPKLDCSSDASVTAGEANFVECAAIAVAVSDNAMAPVYKALSAAESSTADFTQRDAGIVASASLVPASLSLQDYRTKVVGLLSGRNVDLSVQAVGLWPSTVATDLSTGLQRYHDLASKVAWSSPQRQQNQIAVIDSALGLVNKAANDDYNARRQAVRTLAGLIDSVSLNDYIDVLDSPCGGALFGKGLERKFTISVIPTGATTASVTSDVTTVCATRAFVSTGFTFASGGERTFGTVPINSANPAITPTTNNTIIESTRSDVRALSLTFVNIGLTQPTKSGDGWFGSFGIAIGSGSDSSTSFAAGASYSFARTFVLTVGGFLASRTELAPGYAVGDPIASNITNPPTVSRSSIRPFLGLSFNL